VATNPGIVVVVGSVTTGTEGPAAVVALPTCVVEEASGDPASVGCVGATPVDSVADVADAAEDDDVAFVVELATTVDAVDDETAEDGAEDEDEPEMVVWVMGASADAGFADAVCAWADCVEITPPARTHATSPAASPPFATRARVAARAENSAWRRDDVGTLGALTSVLLQKR
jgi:hypothetical protein